MNMFKKNGGFTLVELIVVIAILAILAAVAVPAYNGYIGSANEAADTTQLAAIKTACMAAAATEGTVTEITVTTDATSKAVTKIEVKYGTKDTAEQFYPAGDGASALADEFATFYGATTMPTMKSEKFAGGAKWPGTGDDAGEWVKK